MPDFSSDPMGLGHTDEPARNAGSSHLDQLLETTIARTRASLTDEIRIEHALLPISFEAWADGHPEARTPVPMTARRRVRRRRLRMKYWFRDRMPVVHVGPCNHEDCY